MSSVIASASESTVGRQNSQYYCNNFSDC